MSLYLGMYCTDDLDCEYRGAVFIGCTILQSMLIVNANE